MSDETIEVMTREGKPWRVGRARFEEMARALMAVLPSDPPGLKVAEAKAALIPLLDPVLFPAGAKAGWWLKAVQLDHEYHGRIKRAEKPPVRLYKS